MTVGCVCVGLILGSPSYGRYRDCSKANSPHSAIFCFLFNFQHPLLSLRPSTNCLRLLPRVPVIYILRSISPSVTCFMRHFLRKMWPSQLAFLLFFLQCMKDVPFHLDTSVTLLHFFTLPVLTELHPSPASRFKIFELFLIFNYCVNKQSTQLKFMSFNAACFDL